MPVNNLQSQSDGISEDVAEKREHFSSLGMLESDGISEDVAENREHASILGVFEVLMNEIIEDNKSLHKVITKFKKASEEFKDDLVEVKDEVEKIKEGVLGLLKYGELFDKKYTGEDESQLLDSKTKHKSAVKRPGQESCGNAIPHKRPFCP